MDISMSFLRIESPIVHDQNEWDPFYQAQPSVSKLYAININKFILCSCIGRHFDMLSDDINDMV